MTSLFLLNKAEINDVLHQHVVQGTKSFNSDLFITIIHSCCCFFFNFFGFQWICKFSLIYHVYHISGKKVTNPHVGPHKICIKSASYGLNSE